MVPNKNFLITFKLLLALLGFSAIITEIVALTERGLFNPVNFFSYFTVETNILVFITLLASAIAVAAGKNHQLDALRGAVTVYILIVGIGFSALLAGLQDVALTAVPWDNVVLHYIMPAAVLADFLLDRPKRKLQFRRSLWWLALPVAYVAYSLARGAVVGWYPYPFLNPDLKGYGTVAFTVFCLLVLSLALIWAIAWLTGGKSVRPFVKRMAQG